MNESKLTQKDTTRQEPIKHFDMGVVGYSLFMDFSRCAGMLVHRLKFLTKAGLDLDEYPLKALDLIESLALDAESELDEIEDEARKECKEAGGDNVMTVKEGAWPERKRIGGMELYKKIKRDHAKHKELVDAGNEKEADALIKKMFDKSYFETAECESEIAA